MAGVAEVVGTTSNRCMPHLQTQPSKCFFTPRPSQRFHQRRGALGVVCAKKDIHPKYYDEAKVICNGEEVLTVSGTKEQYTVDIWSGNHPFFTKSGATIMLDEGRVTRFNNRFDGLSLGVVAKADPNQKKLEYKVAGKGKQQKGKGKK